MKEELAPRFEGWAIHNERAPLKGGWSCHVFTPLLETSFLWAVCDEVGYYSVRLSCVRGVPYYFYCEVET